MLSHILLDSALTGEQDNFCSEEDHYAHKDDSAMCMDWIPKHIALAVERKPNHDPGLEFQALSQFTTYGPTGC